MLPAPIRLPHEDVCLAPMKLQCYNPIQASGYCPTCQLCPGIRVSQNVAMESTQHWHTIGRISTKNCELINPVKEFLNFLHMDLITMIS